MNKETKVNIIVMMKQYFEKDEILLALERIDKWGFQDSSIFYQISQDNENIEFEFGGVNDFVLYDFTIRKHDSVGPVEGVTITPLSKISVINMVKTAKKIVVYIIPTGVSRNNIFKYEAFSEENQKRLEMFYDLIVRLVGKRGQ